MDNGDGEEEVIDMNGSLATAKPAIIEGKKVTDDIEDENTNGLTNRNSSNTQGQVLKETKFDKRNRDFLKGLSEKNKQKVKEEKIAERRLEEYKEKLKNTVRKRLGSSLEDLSQNNNNKNVQKIKNNEERPEVPIVETEDQIAERKRKAQERKKFSDKHSQYLEKIAEKNREKKNEAAREEELKRIKREKLAKRVTKMSSNKNNVFPPKPPASPTLQLLQPPDKVNNKKAAGSGAAAVRATRKNSEDSNNSSGNNSVADAKATNERIRKRQEEHMEKLRIQREEKEIERRKRTAIKEKGAQKRRDKIIQEAKERKKNNSNNNNNNNNEEEEEDDDDVDDDGDDEGSTKINNNIKKTKKKKAGNDNDKKTAKKALASFMSRLEKNTEKRNESKLNWNDMDEARWRRAQGIDEDTKVFIITGFYPSLREALLERGWFENPDRHSRFFNLKWTIASKHINHSEIEDHQIVNHFSRASSIVTKIGLMKNIRNLKHFANVNIDRFFPRCYDLNDIGDKEDFKDDFRCVRAQQILKQILIDLDLKLPQIRVRPRTVPLSARSSMTSEDGNDDENEVDANAKVDHNNEDDNRVNNDGETENKETTTIATKKKKRKKKKKFHSGINVNDDRDFYEAIPEPELKQIAQGCTKELKINPSVLRAALRILQKLVRPLDDEYIDKPVRHIELLVEPEEWACINPDRLGIYESGPPREEVQQKKSKKAIPAKTPTLQERRAAERKIRNRNKYAWKPTDYTLRPITKDEILEILQSIDLLRINPSHQSNLNGNPTKNVWIIKPAGKSRGRGIQCFDNYDEIMKVTDSNCNGQESQWVAQKYIEHPLIILGRKFDIRQWVLVTDWNPLTVYFFDECYLRFCASDYSLDDLKDRFIHLANNSVAKKSKKFKESVIEGNMWHSDQFIEYLGEEHGSEDLWENKIQKQMKKIVTWSTMSVQDMVQNRRRSCELYGYDFMVDENLDVWLIEVNSSPAMDYSTDITERLVTRVLPDCVKVLADYEYSGKKKKPKNIDLGGWELLYRAKKPIEYPRSALSSDLTIDGKEIKNPYKKVVRNRLPTAKKINLGGRKKSKSSEEEDNNTSRKKRGNSNSFRQPIVERVEKKIGVEPFIEKSVKKDVNNNARQEYKNGQLNQHRLSSSSLASNNNNVAQGGRIDSNNATMDNTVLKDQKHQHYNTNSRNKAAFSKVRHLVPHPPILDTRKLNCSPVKQLHQGNFSAFNLLSTISKQQKQPQPVGDSNPLYKKVAPRYLNIGQSKNDVAQMLMRHSVRENQHQQRGNNNINNNYYKNGNIQNKRPVAMKVFDPFAMIPQQRQPIKKRNIQHGGILGRSITGRKGELSLNNLMPQTFHQQGLISGSVGERHDNITRRIGLKSTYQNFQRKSLW